MDKFRSENQLDRIATLAATLPPPLSTFVETVDSCIDYCVDEGECQGIGIWKEEGLAVQIASATAGSVFPLHRHAKEREVIGIISGRGVYTTGGVDIVIEPCEAIIIEPGVAHSWKFPEKTRLWAITMPADRGFPDVPGEQPPE